MWGLRDANRAQAPAAAVATTAHKSNSNWHRPYPEIVSSQRRAHVLQQRRRQDYERAELEEYLHRVRSVDSAIGLQRRHGRGFVDHIESDLDREARERAQELQLQRQIQARAADSASRLQRAEQTEAEVVAETSRRKMLQRLIEQDPELRRLRLHLDRAYQRRDNDASAAIRAREAAIAEEAERQRVAAREAARLRMEEEDRRLRAIEEARIADNRQKNWNLHKQRAWQAQEDYRQNVHRERLVNAFVDDQLDEEDAAAQRFAEENRQQLLTELRAQEDHHARQKALLKEQERLAEEQDEWCALRAFAFCTGQRIFVFALFHMGGSIRNRTFARCDAASGIGVWLSAELSQQLKS